MSIHAVNYHLNNPAIQAEIGGIPDSILDAARDKILRHLKKTHPDQEFDPKSVIVERFRHTQWNDASLGCSEDEKFYAQVITPGYEIEFSVGDEKFTMHTNGNGSLIVSPDFWLDGSQD
jgi:hypothetical protein